MYAIFYSPNLLSNDIIISSDIINRPEAKILDKIAAELQELYGKGTNTVTFVNSSGDAEVISGPSSLRDTVFKIGKV